MLVGYTSSNSHCIKLIFQIPLNPAFTSTQIASALVHLDASYLIIGAETNLPYKPPKSNIPVLESLLNDLKTPNLKDLSTKIPSLRQVILVNNSHGRIDISPYKSLVPYADVFEDGGDGQAGLRPEEVGNGEGLRNDEVINISFTSGTTSMPKAACLTHRSLLNNGKGIGDRMRLTEKDVICCPPPLFQYVERSILGLPLRPGLRILTSWAKLLRWCFRILGYGHSWVLHCLPEREFQPPSCPRLSCHVQLYWSAWSTYHVRC
jgi:long-subunit acyl-CoA synthetase (AMP-forming)